MVPENHKFAVLAMQTGVQLGVGKSQVEVGHQLIASLDPPTDFLGHLKGWLSANDVAQVERCNLFFVTAAPSDEPDILNDESAWLQYRVDVFEHMLALTSVGFRRRYGIFMLGARVGDRWSVRSASPLRNTSPTPGTPEHFVLTPSQMRQADRLVSTLWNVQGERHRGRLWRALRAFDAAMFHGDLSSKLHELVRAIEGVMPIPASPKERGQRSQREWFADKLGLLWQGTADRERLLALYDARGATEHLALPIRDLQKANPALTAEAAEVQFAQLVFLAEGLARHALVRVLESPAILTRFETEEGMHQFWAEDEVTIRAAWGESFDATYYVAAFDPVAAHDSMERGRADRRHARALMSRAPYAYRGIVTPDADN